MKKIVLIALAAFLFTTTACATGNKTSSKGVRSMKLYIQIDNGKTKHELTATLYDNSSSPTFIRRSVPSTPSP